MIWLLIKIANLILINLLTANNDYSRTERYRILTRVVEYYPTASNEASRSMAFPDHLITQICIHGLANRSGSLHKLQECHITLIGVATRY